MEGLYTKIHESGSLGNQQFTAIPHHVGSHLQNGKEFMLVEDLRARGKGQKGRPGYLVAPHNNCNTSGALVCPFQHVRVWPRKWKECTGKLLNRPNQEEEKETYLLQMGNVFVNLFRIDT